MLMSKRSIIADRGVGRFHLGGGESLGSAAGLDMVHCVRGLSKAVLQVPRPIMKSLE